VSNVIIKHAALAAMTALVGFISCLIVKCGLAGSSPMQALHHFTVGSVMAALGAVVGAVGGGLVILVAVKE
jgi:hypothetical protein